MSDGVYKPNPRVYKPIPLPDVMFTRDGRPFNPNAPAPPREPVQDRRPGTPQPLLGGKSLEQIAKEEAEVRNSRQNGRTDTHNLTGLLVCVDSLGNEHPECSGKNCYHTQRMKGNFHG